MKNHTGDLIDAFFLNAKTATVEQSKEAVAETAIKFTIMTFCGMAAFGIQHFCLQVAHARLGTAMREAFLTALVKQEMSFFDIKKIGALTVVLSEGEFFVVEVFSCNIGDGFELRANLVYGFVKLNEWI